MDKFFLGWFKHFSFDLNFKNLMKLILHKFFVFILIGIVKMDYIGMNFKYCFYKTVKVYLIFTFFLLFFGLRLDVLCLFLSYFISNIKITNITI